MFTPRAAFQVLNGQEFTYQELRKKLDEISAENIEELPPEFGSRELLAAAEVNNWIQPSGDRLLVVVPDANDSDASEGVAA